MFGRKKPPQPKEYDREHLTPVVRCSICTGEQVAGFKDRRTGKFTELVLIRKPEDLQAFMQEYGIEAITHEY